MKIGYYIHHHGRGHATRAGVIGAAARARGHEVTFLGSGALPDGDGVALTHDARREDAPFVDATAHGRLHWAPLRGGYAERSRQFARWVDVARPDVIVVDVSVEVTALARLLGVPTVVVAQPGLRDDAPHALAYDLADAIIAPWPAGLDVAPHLARWAQTRVEIGGLSRFATHGEARCRSLGGDPAGSEQTARSADDDGPLRGVILVGGEGWDDADLPQQIRAAIPAVEWQEPDSTPPIEALLARADVAVSHAGQNALADLASFHVPTVIVPQERPFGEQADMARALDEARIARGLRLGARVMDIADAVRDVVSGADRDDGRWGCSWQRWNVTGAAGRAVDVVERVGGKGSGTA